MDTSVEALSVSMGEKAAVDLEYMEGLTGRERGIDSIIPKIKERMLSAKRKLRFFAISTKKALFVLTPKS